MTGFEIEETVEGEVCVLDLIGPLPPRVAREVEERLIRILRSHGRFLVIDLTQCAAASSPVLRALEAITKELSRLGGSLILCGLNEGIEETVDWAGFRSSLRIEKNRQVAIHRSRQSRTQKPSLAALDDRTRPEMVLELLGSLEPPPFLALQESDDDLLQDL